MTLVRAIAHAYSARLRAQPLREILALAGIAAGVALLFAVQITNKSLTGAHEQMAQGIAGKATLEVAARGPQGFDQRLLRKIDRLPSVDKAAPVLERRIAVVGPKGRRPLTLVGVDERLTPIGGTLVKRFARRSPEASEIGLHLPEPIAKATGVTRGEDLAVQVGERTVQIPVAGILSKEEVGPLAGSPVAIAPLGLAQEITAMPGRITRIAVAPHPGRDGEAQAAMKKVVAGTLDIRPSDAEVGLLYEAAKVDRQSSMLFSAISVVVGLLLAYNAMLLAVMERRPVIATLRMLGTTRLAIAASLIFDALVLGVAGSLTGVALGDQLSRHLLHQVPEFLGMAFPIGNQRVIEPATIALAITSGIVAALAAAAQPAIVLLRVGPLDALPQGNADIEAPGRHSFQRRAFAAGLTVIFLTIGLVALVPAATIVGVSALVVGVVMILPLVITRLLGLAQRLTQRIGGAVTNLSVAELAASPMRATALATIGALAVIVILGTGGASRDLTRGVDRLMGNLYGKVDLWVTPGRDENGFLTLAFDGKEVSRRIRHLPEVDRVRVYRGAYLDLDNHRLLVIGQPRDARFVVEPDQVVEGDRTLLQDRMRQGGWVTLSATLAKEREVRPGQTFSLPTPAGNQHFRLAATTTNYAWASGALVINAQDFGRAWRTEQASALMIDLAGGVPRKKGKQAILDILGENSSLSGPFRKYGDVLPSENRAGRGRREAAYPSGMWPTEDKGQRRFAAGNTLLYLRRGPLRVQTAEERHAFTVASTHRALSKLDQISKMALIAAVIAVAAAMLAAIWLRRQRLAALRALGMGTGQAYRALFLETGLILMIGCLVGVFFGLLIQAMGGRWLKLALGYPVLFSPAWALALKSLILATLLAVIATAIPVRFALRFRPQATFSPE